MENNQLETVTFRLVNKQLDSLFSKSRIVNN